MLVVFFFFLKIYNKKAVHEDLHSTCLSSTGIRDEGRVLKVGAHAIRDKMRNYVS